MCKPNTAAMAPKGAMKSAAKAAPKKAAAKKVSKDLKPKPTGASPKSKAKAKAKGKSSPSHQDLASQVTETLDEKLARLRQSQNPFADSKLELSKLDRSKLWNRSQRDMKANEEMKADYDNAPTKGARSKVLLAWQLDPAKGDLFRSVTATAMSSQSTQKAEKWTGWSKLLKDGGWTEEEGQMHLASGRFSERECPQTKNVWEYMDNHDITYLRTLQKTKAAAVNQQVEQTEDEEIEFQQFFDSLSVNASSQSLALPGAWDFGTGKSGGKGCPGLLVFGKGKGKSKGKAHEDPIPEEPKTTEQLLEIALCKARQCINHCDKTKLALQEDEAALKKTAYYTKPLAGEYKKYGLGIDSFLVKLKNVVLGKAKNKSLEFLQALLGEACLTIKDCKEFMSAHKAMHQVKDKDKASAKGEE